MRIMTEETFGPVLPIMTFYELDDAVALANDCPYGLTASVWTRDRKTAAWLAVLHQEGIGRKLKASLALLPSLSMVRAGVSFKSILKIAARLFRR